MVNIFCGRKCCGVAGVYGGGLIREFGFRGAEGIAGHWGSQLA
jgi:hypothetical protein